MDDAIDEAARLNSLAADGQHGTPGPLQELWDQSPNVLESLPFMGSNDKAQAAKAFVYESGIWLAQAQGVFPLALKQSQENAESPDTVHELAANIQTIQYRRSFLMRLGYESTLDGVTGTAADLARKINNAGTGVGIGLGVGAVAVIALAIYFVLR